MQPWIQNVSLANVRDGYHYDAGLNSVLIQIVDPAMEFPVPKEQFRSIHRFEFLDLEEEDAVGLGFCEFKITDEQALGLTQILKQALDRGSNVVVHCVAGVCRSGAVAEVGIAMGFRDTESFRAPNLMVKHKMLSHAMDLGYV